MLGHGGPVIIFGRFTSDAFLHLLVHTQHFTRERIFSTLKESSLKHKNHNILAFQRLSQHFSASRLIGMQKNKRRSTKHQRAQTESGFILDSVCFLMS